MKPTDVVKVKAIVAEIVRRGMPNYFGEQRFGHRGNNDQLGAAVVRGDARGLLGLLLGNPLPNVDDRKTQHAREAFDRGDLPQAMKLYPLARNGTANSRPIDKDKETERRRPRGGA